jgi:hypothetical protein
MPSVLKVHKNLSRVALTVLLLGVTVLLLLYERPSVPAIEGGLRDHPLLASNKGAVAHPDSVRVREKPPVHSPGHVPGGAQPWVPWTYIP